MEFARVRTFTCAIRVGSPAGVRRAEGLSSAGPGAVPGRWRDPIPSADDQHSRQLRAQNGQGEGTGERDWEVQRPSDRGRRAGESPPPPLPSDTAGQSVDVAGWGVKRRAAAASPAPWRTCQNADMQRDIGTRSPTGWWRSAHLMSALTRLWTVVFLVSYIHCRGRLKRPFLHCRADSGHNYGYQLTAA